MSRRCASKVTHRSCPFQFSIKWDHLGFFIPLNNKGGCSFHNFHPSSTDISNLAIPTCFLGEQEKDTLFSLAQSCCLNGVSCNYVFTRIGKFLSTSKISYLSKQDSSGNDSTENDYDNLLSYFQQTDDISYSVLWDVPVSQFSQETDHPTTPIGAFTSPTWLLSHTKVDCDTYTEKDLTNETGMNNMQFLVREGCLLNKTPESSKVFVAVACVVKRELHFLNFSQKWSMLMLLPILLLRNTIC